MMNEKKNRAALYEQKNGYDGLSDAEEREMEAYCKGYKEYLDNSKTERLCVEHSIFLAEKNGFVRLRDGQELCPGDKIYFVNRNKNLFLAVIGEQSLADGANISIAHVDSPHLDVKPRAIYEQDGMTYCKTYLYGWLRKHHYLALPLALHGIVLRNDGSKVRVDIGEKEDDPVFLINDLLPHLGAKQGERPLKDVVPNEGMNVLVGSRPVASGETDQRFKRTVMNILCDHYGIEEEDFISAELEFVPAGKAHDAGFDRSLIASYGHDDRVCAYAALSALFAAGTPKKTAICCLVDKEEVNSNGVSGILSRAFDRFMKKICNSQEVDLDDCYAGSYCISADVTSAFDPNFEAAYDRRNAAFVNCGIAMSKFTDHGGDKSDGSDADAETVSKFRILCNANNVRWQSAEIGDPEYGGGGTVAKFMANRGIETIDAGVPVLSMHAPYETVAKIDCYMTYKTLLALYRDM